MRYEIKNIYFSFLFIVFSFGLFNQVSAITRNVGAAEVSPNYTTLQAAFADINAAANSMTGAITLNITSNIAETVFPIVLNTNDFAWFDARYCASRS